MPLVIKTNGNHDFITTVIIADEARTFLDLCV